MWPRCFGYTVYMVQSRQYTVELTNFAGPLDLLLTLIERRELEITEVAIGQVTGDYLRTISAIERIDERELMWFLDVATKLLGYKSRALRLASQPVIEDEDTDIGTSLADLTEQLRQLQQVREQSKNLARLYGVAFTNQGDKALITELPPRNLRLEKLTEIWNGLKARAVEGIELPRHEVKIARFDIAVASQRLLGLLKGQIHAKQLLSEGGTTRDRVERLLALLEMIKQNLIELMSEGEEHYVQAAR